MHHYDPEFIEKKWQTYWEKHHTFRTPTHVIPEKKRYILPQLPYPSGSGLHVGHAEVYTACDIVARFERMQGNQVLQVIGWDSFGLPAENYAIKTNIHPKESTNSAIDNFRSQIKSLGISVDWEREVGSHNPDYYTFTQWFFLLMYKRGLAYRKQQSVNWCESCKTVLANEQVTNQGSCERCDTQVVQKEMEQWYLKITEYAEKLLEGLDRIDWPEETKARQRNWIGKSEGAYVHFSTKGIDERITVFTTRPDTLFGATYLVLAPEHPFISQHSLKIQNSEEVLAYVDATKKKTELDRQVQKEKTGVELRGIVALHPVTGEEIPVWIADYVLATYGTGAIMAVPAHDERDFSFAIQYQLPIRSVVAPHIVLTGDATPREDKPVSKKDVVTAIVRDPKTQEYIVLDWGGRKGFVGGGVEEGESFDNAIIREIKEETGYTDIAIVDIVLPELYGHGYKPRKNINCFDLDRVYLVDVLDRTQRVSHEGDTNEHTICWVPASQVSSHLTLDHHQFMWQWYNQQMNYFVGDGIAVRSQFLDGLTTIEAKECMIRWLEEHNSGERHTQYKLRDWSVSRQRFWGAPIPMVMNDSLSQQSFDYVFIHGFGGNSQSNFFPWLKIELEQKGHTVTSLDLPHTDAPNVQEQAAYILEHVPITDRTIFVAHSLGGPVVYRILEQIASPVMKVVFVDPVYTPVFSDDDRPAVTLSDSFEFDFDVIKTRAHEFVILEDAYHTTIPKEHIDILTQLLDARRVSLSLPVRHVMVDSHPAILEESLVSGLRPVHSTDLPVLLPDDVDFKPTGQSPLTYSSRFQEGVEELYGQGFTREVDTLDTFMCSSWYYYRYLDPHNSEQFASEDSLRTWMPVDFYLGGEEHVNGHLLYARFFTKVLHDAGYITFDEPFTKHRHQGLILGEDSRKMSKRWGNVINPTDVVRMYGADTCRVYEMFMGPLEETKPWNEQGVKGVRRFLDRVWRLFIDEKTGKLFDHITSQAMPVEQERILHKTIKKVGDHTNNLQFNTAISSMMECVNAAYKWNTCSHQFVSQFTLLLAPYAPHLAEELWAKLGHHQSLAHEQWPVYDDALIQEDTHTIAIQINGKIRDTMVISADMVDDNDSIIGMALIRDSVQKWLQNASPKKTIYVRGKLVSIVI